MFQYSIIYFNFTSVWNLFYKRHYFVFQWKYFHSKLFYSTVQGTQCFLYVMF